MDYSFSGSRLDTHMQQLRRLILSALLPSSRAIWVGGLFSLLIILAVPSNGQSCGTVTTNLCRPFVPRNPLVTSMLFAT